MTRTRTIDHDLAPTRSWAPRYVHLWWVLAGAAVLAAAILLAPLLEMPSHIEQFSFENPTTYDITVEASDDGTGWTPIGTVDAGESADFERVYDQGDQWVFRFSSQGRDAGTLERTRDQLEQDDWHVVIPASVGETLQADGAPEPG
jgi:hypothetical protein